MAQSAGAWRHAVAARLRILGHADGGGALTYAKHITHHCEPGRSCEFVVIAGRAASSGRQWTNAKLAFPLRRDWNGDREMDVGREVLRLLDEVLGLGGRSVGFVRSTPLLGVIPELDSMAVVTLITTMEERFDFVIQDDEISGDAFVTVGALEDFVAGKLAS